MRGNVTSFSATYVHTIRFKYPYNPLSRSSIDLFNRCVSAGGSQEKNPVRSKRGDIIAEQFVQMNGDRRRQLFEGVEGAWQSSSSAVRAVQLLFSFSLRSFSRHPLPPYLSRASPTMRGGLLVSLTPINERPVCAR